VSTRRRPDAVWVCGAAASGKSRIAEGAVLPLGFELLDVDTHYERLAASHQGGSVSEAPEDRGRVRSGAKTRRAAERLAVRLSSGGWIDPRAFAEELEAEVELGVLEAGEARRLADESRKRFGEEPVAGRVFRSALWPKMADLADPEEYLQGRPTVTRQHLLVVARELVRRQIERARSGGRNLLFVETGGQTGRLLRRRRELRADGYGTFLVWVSISSPTLARRRNALRRRAGGRALPEAAIVRSFAVAERVQERLVEAFSPDVLEIDNSPEGEEALRRAVRRVRRHLGAWIRR
jgi:predicted ABC-type ATPase